MLSDSDGSCRHIHTTARQTIMGNHTNPADAFDSLRAPIEASKIPSRRHDDVTLTLKTPTFKHVRRRNACSSGLPIISRPLIAVDSEHACVDLRCMQKCVSWTNKSPPCGLPQHYRLHLTRSALPARVAGIDRSQRRSRSCWKVGG